MKLALFCSLAVSAAAFAPASTTRQSSTLSASFENELGAQKPLGLFDPLMIVKDESQEQFDKLREIEIKHGRVSMLAVTGYLTTVAGIRFPGAEDIPAGFKAFSTLWGTTDGQNVMFQFLAFVGVAEMANRDNFGLATFPGDYRNGALDFGWDKYDEKTKMRKRSIELNNGRAAQMGILGLMTHELMGVSILPGGVLP